MGALPKGPHDATEDRDLLAGTASTNHVLFVLAVLLVLAWKVAGYYGLDYWLLP